MTLALVLLVVSGPALRDPADASPRGAEPTAPTAPAPSTPAPDDARRPTPVPALPLAAAQCLGGCAVLAASAPLALVCTTATCVGAPFVVGYFETWIGDRFGGGRAPALIPIATAYAGATGAALTGAVVYGVATLQGAPLGLAAPAALATAGAGLALSAAAVPIAYAFAATPKHALDDGSEPPDFTAPRTPHAVKRAQRRQARDSP